MNKPAVIKASFADYRRIRGRKQGQLIFELPLEQLHDAIKALGGEPSVEGATWCAIATLNGQAEEPKTAEPKDRQKFSRLRPSAQAALLCEKSTFWTFLNESGWTSTNSEEAAETVRTLCAVESRSELDRDESAAQAWFGLRDRFDAWMAVGE